MAKKRGTSGLSLVVGVNKPTGMSSHDVVNRVRRIFGERRVGHTGTLDPLANGALLVCVGPATRLDNYFVGHDKQYQVRVMFGVSTDTDDAEGNPLHTGPIPSELYDWDHAVSVVKSFEGPSKQLPPVYSALKVDGVKACDAARKGHVIELQPRDIEVYSAVLLAIVPCEDTGLLAWDIDFHVSKGTYIRSLARDMGLRVGCPAHVDKLQRNQAGLLKLEECVTLETLEEMGTAAALDPVYLLGYRFAFLSDEQAERVSHGNILSARAIQLYQRRRPLNEAAEFCACTSGVCESCEPPADGEVVCFIHENKLVALYQYTAERKGYKSACGFTVGVSRGQLI